jgi:hypothetical protein
MWFFTPWRNFPIALIISHYLPTTDFGTTVLYLASYYIQEYKVYTRRLTSEIQYNFLLAIIFSSTHSGLFLLGN